MLRKPNEKGQALIIIAFAAVALFALSALAIDGSRNFSQKRYAQNAADTSVMAGALAHARNADISAAALARATSNGFDNNGTTNTVTVTIVDSPSGVCPANTQGKDITVEIVSTIDTTFGRVLGRETLTNAVTATSRACGSYTGPPFDGNAIVALAPSGKGYEGTGTPDWNITGGGIFSNSSSSNAAYCNGAADINAPSVTVVGGTDFNCHGVNVGTTTTGAGQYTYSSVAALFPRQPACNGTASFSSGQWHPQAGTDGSRVAFSGNMDFAPGLYCITNSPGPYHGAISGSEVTFYIMSPSFSMKFNGGGNLTASAPTSGEYKGILLYLAPQIDAYGNLLNTQAIDMRGNGTGDIVGSIIAPSADVTMFGNSGTGAFNSQIIGYHVDSGGNANINVSYQSSDNYQATLPITLTVLK
ncbi:MAG: pilus assembly protein TadG-related protein [Anaerolineales bacterium]|nr:pilus assembly protein TadG-related protein [Anaerolineales bacterium]